MSKKQVQVEKRKFNFEEVLQEAIDRNRKIKLSPYLQGELLKINESAWESDSEFYNSDEGHIYNDEMQDQGPYDQSELEQDVNGDTEEKIGELVKKVEMYCSENYEKSENPDLFRACNELLSSFYKLKASGKPDGNFGSCTLQIYRNLKNNKSDTLANQFSTETIFDELEELNQLIGELSQNSSTMASPFTMGY